MLGRRLVLGGRGYAHVHRARRSTCSATRAPRAPSTRGEHSLAGIASWSAGAGGEPDKYTVPAAGETVQEIRDRTGVTAITDSTGTAFADPAHRFTGGAVVNVVGVRWHTAIAEDTRGQVANQHGIGQPALERANRLPAAAPTTPITAGTVLLIPAA